MYDFAIVGGGIVGLATALQLVQRYPNARVVLLEKESTLAYHQTGHNSGVIHSGIYYKPGSFKARFCLAGHQALVQFCREQQIAYDLCGKVIVATTPQELPLLDTLYQRGLDHGLKVQKLTGEQVRAIEPHVRCLGGVRVPTTGIVDYRQVAHKYAELILAGGAEIHLDTKVEGLRSHHGVQILQTRRGELEANFLINCAGLFSDRMAHLAGVDPLAQIVPFRGEYYELVPERRYLVKTLIYPVPNPDFPFLGVHFTRMIDGSVHCGPNAVLSLKREGYRKRDFDLQDMAEVLGYRGFWKLIARHAPEGLQEMLRSLSRHLFVRSLQRLIPEVQACDLLPTPSGVRAQALKPDGQLVDDFLIVPAPHQIHVCNAPSPAATSSLEIGRAIVAQIPLLPSAPST
ncbi:L-2-hydroxyglutarate oxidase [Anthocerotibacter panamensis]|uniref:L-2-hydroxyglutarate oxidase n=1 Tax=Anthocerotibacter panamensis TaxID=2857077 RepID=UPI001C4080D1